MPLVWVTYLWRYSAFPYEAKDRPFKGARKLAAPDSISEKGLVSLFEIRSTPYFTIP